MPWMPYPFINLLYKQIPSVIPFFFSYFTFKTIRKYISYFPFTFI